MSDSVLVTGGAGFIGTALVKRLAPSGERIVAVDSLHPQVHATQEWPYDYPGGVERYTLDVTEPSTWDTVFEEFRPDVVVHMAAETGTGQSLTQASRHSRVNVVGTTELLDGLTRVGHTPRTIVLSSSRAVYGEGQWTDSAGTTFYPTGRSAARLEAGLWDPAAPEGTSGEIRPLPHRGRGTEPRPANVYAATKLAQEHVLEAWCTAMGTNLAILRFQNVYGPGQSLTNPYTGVVSLFAQLGLAGKPIDVYEDGDIIRDFVFVEDVVSAIASAIKLDSGTPYPLDIGFGKPTSMLQIATMIADQASAPAPIVSGRYRLGDVRAAYADISDAQEILGYWPEVDVATGVSRLLDSISATLAQQK